jgi:hypothetical protein
MYLSTSFGQGPASVAIAARLEEGGREEKSNCGLYNSVLSSFLLPASRAASIVLEDPYPYLDGRRAHCLLNPHALPLLLFFASHRLSLPWMPVRDFICLPNLLFPPADLLGLSFSSPQPIHAPTLTRSISTTPVPSSKPVAIPSSTGMSTRKSTRRESVGSVEKKRGGYINRRESFGTRSGRVK